MAGSPEITIYPTLRLPAYATTIVYLQCYFVTIATILGTGVLGLPVTLSHSGLYPFLVSFIICFFMQALLIYFFTDVLQRLYVKQVLAVKESDVAHSLLNSVDEDDSNNMEMEHDSNEQPLVASHIVLPKDDSITPPNLHIIGQMFLPCGLRQLFDIVLVIQFVALLISYALAGSQAYAEVMHIRPAYVIPVFVWVLTFAVVFALGWIQPIVTILTFVKGSLLLATVAVTMFVGAAINHDVHNDFTYIGAPFLMGTVALGGVINVMPFLYAKIQPVPAQVKGFRSAILAGLVTCAILNILWCWAVLEIVPQRNTCFRYELRHNNSHHTIDPHDSSPQFRTICAHNVSIESAAANGEISTVPLTQIIDELYPQYDWVAVFVELFIMISITVSYLTIGAAMHHTLSGWVDSLWSHDSLVRYRAKISKRKLCSCRCLFKCAVSLLIFAVVFAVAISNPKGFESVLEKVASLFINLEAGFFVFLIIRKATKIRSVDIPVPMAAWVYQLQYLIPVYFLFAVFYDVFTSVFTYLHGGQDDRLPWESGWQPAREATAGMYNKAHLNTSVTAWGDHTTQTPLSTSH